MSSVTEILVVGCIGENVGFENVYETGGVFGRGCALLLALYSFRVGVYCYDLVTSFCGGLSSRGIISPFDCSCLSLSKIISVRGCDLLFHCGNYYLVMYWHYDLSLPINIPF